jgi:D-lyxose ketol-isomerase
VKRSKINALIADAMDFIAEHRFHLPPFAAWTLEDWARRGREAREIVQRGLGWDVTDFGLGDYANKGLLLFTIRNGDQSDLETGHGKLYAEKLLICDPNQVTPMHFHFSKTEDIINRGGGTLVLELHWADDANGLSPSAITVSCDGMERHVEPGGLVRLSPGESITLPTRLYHAFWAEGSRVLVGEVSTVNDDATDNHFLEGVGRFPQILEDEPPLRLLVGDYVRWCAQVLG